MNPKAVILTRLARELSRYRKVLLGPGLPEEVRSLLTSQVETVPLEVSDELREGVEVVVTEAGEVSLRGDFSPSSPIDWNGRIRPARWIVADFHRREDGSPRIVAVCRSPVFARGRVDTIITELGVLEVNEVGLVLRELAPGVSADDVRKHTDASLHVADDIRLMSF